MAEKNKMSSRKIKIALWLLAGLLIYTMSGFFLVPVVAKYFLEKDLPSVLKRPVHIEKLYFNPFTLDVRINGLEIGEKGTRNELVSLKELEVNLQAVSLIKRALVLSEIRVINPEIRIYQDKKGVFNFENILSGYEEETEKGPPSPFLFSLNNIRISNGTISFEDELKGVSHKISNLNIGIPFISNLKTRIKIYTKPYFSAVVNGAPLEFKGETRPFAVDHATRLRIKLTDLDLAHYLAYISEFINFKIDSGRLATDLALTFVMKNDGSNDVELDGNVTLSSLSMSQRGKVFLRIPRITLDVDPSNLVKKSLWLSSVAIENPWLEVVKNSNGVLNLETLIPEKSQSPEKEKGKTPEGKPELLPLDIRIARAVLNKGQVHYKDFTAGNSTFETTINSLNLKVLEFTTLKGKPARIHLSLQTGKGGGLDLNGTATVNPVSVALTGKLSSLNIPGYSAYFQDYLNSTIKKGRADILANLSLKMADDKTPDVKVNNISLRLSSLEISDPTSAKGANLVVIPRLDLSGGSLDLSGKTIHVSSVQVDNPACNMVIDKTGRINASAIVRLPEKEAGAEDSSGKKVEDSFRFLLDNLDLKNGKVMFSDLSGKKPVKLSLGNIDIGLRALDTMPGKKSTFSLSAVLGKKGNVRVKGMTDLALKDFQASLDLKKIGLRQFQGYVSRFSNAIIYKGSLFYKGKISLASADNGSLVIKASGNSSLYGGTILGPGNRKPVLRWRKIGIGNIRFKNEPLNLHVKEVSLDRVATNIVFDQKGNLNVLALLKDEKSKDDAKVSSEVKNKKSSSPDIRIDLVSLKDCAVEVVDKSVKPAFLRSVKHIAGKIRGLSSDPQVRAELNITGVADNSAAVEVTGFVNPLAKPIYADITFKSNGIGMTRFSPYTAKFLGYVIDKGKLSTQVHLVIKDDKISAENRLFLDQFDFGHSVESKDAVSLPVKLAIALLKDRNGKINVEIPVSGRLDDPQFSLGGAIMHAIINLFVKAATSPFALLSAIAGGGEDLQQIEFKPGSMALSEDAEKKLAGLAKALQERPALKVELAGYYDPVLDEKGLRELRFMRLLKKEKMQDLEDEEREKLRSVDDVEIKKDEFNKYLTEAYKEAPFDKPRMIIGLLKKQPPEVMERMLREHIKITQGDLENLALGRAQTVQNYFVHQGGIEHKRIFLTSPMRAESGQGGKGTIVKLTLK